MYSVLIFNQKTAADFYRHYPIFTEALNSEKIGICQWNEHGTDIESALPEIYELVDGKKEWRAVIVLPEVEGNSQFPSTQDNPFDFKINDSEDAPVAESPVPVIRLTQMIGGVPAPTVKFVSEQVSEEGRALRTIYRPEISESEQVEYKQLCEKYHFNGIPPTEILLVAARAAQEQTSKELERVWQQNNEILSSNFWKRNRYPSICRFSVFDIEKRGDTRKTEEIFKLWTTVLLLAINDFEANIFQAYRLYNVSVRFDEIKMGEIMQESADRAISAKYCLKQRLNRELELSARRGSAIPDYKVKVPVILKAPPNTRKSVDGRKFGVVSGSYSEETDNWNQMHEEAKNGLDTMNVWAERALDRASDGVRELCSYDKDKVVPLGRYQLEDFQSSLEKVNHRIYALRSNLPSGNVGDKEKLDECSKMIKQKILERLSSSTAFVCFFFAVIITVASVFSGFVINAEGSANSPVILIAVTVVAVVLLGLIELAALLIQNTELQGWIAKYNSLLNRAVTRIAENSAKFSDYMSSIASYMKGKDYLSTVEQGNMQKTELQDKIKRHITAVDQYIEDLKAWSFAFHLNTDFEYNEINERQSVDMELSPNRNPIYTFESGVSYEIPINRSGEIIRSPFGFIEQISIDREELYDDAK